MVQFLNNLCNTFALVLKTKKIINFLKTKFQINKFVKYNKKPKLDLNQL